MLRQSLGWSKLVYSCRTVPAALQGQALLSFIEATRHALNAIAADNLNDRSWKQATLGIKQGGVGLRDPVLHASCAYFASIRRCRELCSAMDPDFDPQDDGGGLGLSEAISDIRTRILDGAAFDPDSTDTSQKSLSAMVDGAVRRELLLDNTRDTPFQAHMALVQVPGAGTWITAHPVRERSEIDTPLFRVELKRRLRAKIFQEEFSCPCCGRAMDLWGDHAIMCQCGGDRTLRHNSVLLRRDLDNRLC